MIVDGARTDHVHFSDLPAHLKPTDVLVLNETRVIAARLVGRRPSGGAVEVLLLHPAESMRYDPAATRWIALTRPARRLRQGARILFGDGGTLGEATVRAELEDGMREVELTLALPFEAFLAEAGRLPLPPYVRRDSASAQRRYQTVFARVPGSVAAPTASLHFTPELLARLESSGVELARITLDVGLGTFRPMSATRLSEHTMHAEAYAISEPAAEAIERARQQGRRIVAAGTTVVRALEANIQRHGRIVPTQEETDIFITPGFRFRAVDAMITNFHLPRSTLLVLVSAFAGHARIAAAYADAVALRYRFYSFGDAMLVSRMPTR